MSDNKPMIFVKRFYTEYKTDKDGKVREVDWVEYGPIGSAQYLMTPHRIKDLIPAPLEGKNSANPTVQMANARWDILKPKYEAWKKGQTETLNGVPLAAWSGVTPSQAEVLRMAGVYTVEDVSALTDTHKQRIAIPGMTAIVDNAKRYLLSIDKSSVTAALEEKDSQIADLKAQMEDLANLVRSQSAAQSAEPRRRGRPPKVRDEASEAPAV